MKGKILGSNELRHYLLLERIYPVMAEGARNIGRNYLRATVLFQTDQRSRLQFSTYPNPSEEEAIQQQGQAQQQSQTQANSQPQVQPRQQQAQQS